MEIGQRVRSTRDGQLGKIVESAEGGLAVRLDRREEMLVPYRPQTWVPDERAKFTAMQIARVAYEADRALRLVMGEYGVKDFVSLKDAERVATMKGPVAPDGSVRRLLFKAVSMALKDE